MSRQELLTSQDVTIVTKKRTRIYTCSNLVAFLIELSIFAVVQWDKVSAIDFLNFKEKEIDSQSLPLVPMKMQAEVEAFGWTMTFLLQGFFVLRGLINPGQHYINCLLLKIRFAFVLLCTGMTASIFAFALLYNLENFLALLIPNLLFLNLKLTIYYMIYRPLKYKDDGRDVVTFVDFITIHITFPAINAWISYQLYYSAMVTATTICSTDFINNIGTEFCDEWE